MPFTLDQPGYWVPTWGSILGVSPTNWCEPDYVWSPYVAEWWNTLSSIPIFLGAGAFAWSALAQGVRKRFALPLLLMSAVGVGSIAFHGTLLFAGQAADELPMVYAAVSLLYATTSPARHASWPYLPHVLILYCTGFTAAYFLSSSEIVHQFFLGSYIALVVTLFLNAFVIAYGLKQRRANFLLLLAFCFYVGGTLLLWVPDKLMCESVQHLSLHAWFHLSSTIGPLCLIQYVIFAWYARVQAEKAEKGEGGKGRRSPRLAVDGPIAVMVDDLTPEITFFAGLLPVVRLTPPSKMV
jgi:dihydroceramidase